MMPQGNGAMVSSVPGAGVLTKQEFGSTQMVRNAETASSAIAAQAEAAVKARYSLALLRPRDWDDIRRKLLHECARPSLAAVAVYSKPQGRKLNEQTNEWEDNFVEGLSIRFAEVAIRCMGNLMPESIAIYDDEKIRIVRIALSDLEANNYFVKDVVIEKTIERSSLKKGQTPLRTRLNSYNKPVYVLPATDDEVSNKENALASKALRNHVLRVLPGDLQDECRRQLDKTFADKDAKDPDAARKEIADGFAQLNIMPSQIKAWLGHDLATADEGERKQLRKLFAAVKTGETTWAEIMERREEQRGSDAKAAEQPSDSTAQGASTTTPAAPSQPAKNLADLKQREAAGAQQDAPDAPDLKAKAKAPKQKKADASSASGAEQQQQTGAPVDQDQGEVDSGPCTWANSDTGECCPNEGIKYSGHGYRCVTHKP